MLRKGMQNIARSLSRAARSKHLSHAVFTSDKRPTVALPSLHPARVSSATIAAKHSSEQSRLLMSRAAPMVKKPFYPFARANVAPFSTQTTNDSKSMDVKAKGNNHALILSGGGDDYSEESEYLTAKYIYTNLMGSKSFKPENIKLLFGNGEADQKTIISSKKRIYYTHQNEIPIAQSLTLSNVIGQFERLSNEVKAGDTLNIFLEGHGIRYCGVNTWGDSWISPVMLKSELGKIHPQAKKILYVSSCYSGIYLMLGSSRNNISVFTSSNINLISYYKSGILDGHSRLFSCYFTNSNADNLLLLHANGAIYWGNDHASDTLTNYVESHMQSFSPFPYDYASNIRWIYQDFMIKGHEYNGFDLLMGMLKLAGLIDLIKISPVYRIYINMTYSSKAAAIDKKIMDRFVPFSHKLSLTDEAKSFLNKERDNLLWILSKIHELQNNDLSPRYKSLFIKTIDFLTYCFLHSKFDEISQFISIAKTTIDPLNKSKRNQFHEKIVERLWGINNLKNKEEEAKHYQRVSAIKRRLGLFSVVASTVVAGCIYNESHRLVRQRKLYY